MLLPLLLTAALAAALMYRMSVLEFNLSLAASDLLTEVADLSTAFDTFVAAQPVATPPVDLQPVSDAITAVTAKIVAATPAPAAS